jgi:hypothetical protein
MPTVSKQVPAASSSQNKSTDMTTAPKSGSVQSVSYNPVSKITGQDTNSRTLTLVNRGTPSNPKYTPIATLPLTAGVVLDPQVANNIPLTSEVTFDQGDRIDWDSDAVGSGIPDPGGLVSADIRLN